MSLIIFFHIFSITHKALIEIIKLNEQRKHIIMNIKQQKENNMTRDTNYSG